MRWLCIGAIIAICGCAAPGTNLARFYQGGVGKPHKGKEAILINDVLTKQQQKETGLKPIGVIAVVGAGLSARDVLGFGKRVNAVVITVYQEPAGTYSYSIPKFEWVPGTTTRVDGTVRTLGGSTSYVSGTARTPGRLETHTVPMTGTTYRTTLVFWGL